MDRSAEELARLQGGLRPTMLGRPLSPDELARLARPTAAELPAAFDWRSEGAVGAVQRQGLCGSCWAFGLAGNLEGQWQRRTGRLTPLSVQQLLDCSPREHGCLGGDPRRALR